MSSKISALSAGSALVGTEVFPGVLSGANYKYTAAQISTYAANTSTVDHPGYISSRWYPSMNRAAVGNTNMVADRLYASLLHIRAPVTIRGLGVYVNTGAVGKSVKLGVFGLTGGAPDARIAVGSAGVSAASSTTAASTDFTADLVLAPGFYAIAVISDGTPQVTANTASDYPVAPLIGVTSVVNALVAGSFQSGWYSDAGSYAAGIPTSFGAATANTGNSPVAAFQVR